MRVLHVVGGRLRDGATRGALNLHRGLRRLGVDSVLLCPDPDAYGDGLISAAGTPWQALRADLRWATERLPMLLHPRRRRGLFSIGVAGGEWRTHDAFRNADVVHLHWINKGMLSIRGLARIDRPCVWTMRDLWPLTGGCHYPLHCRRYEAACGA